MDKLVFFGGDPLGTIVLDELKQNGIIPSLIVCSPDRLAGRGQKLTKPPVKLWAEANDIPTFQPISYKDKEALSLLTDTDWNLFVVVAYNFILPSWLIELPKHKTINLHPSLLPKLRGPSPIRTAILEDKPEEIGVSVMLLDEKMDHGPLLTQQALPVTPDKWPLAGTVLDEALAHVGGALLAHTIPKWCAGDIALVEQDHSKATYTKKFLKPENEIVIDINALPSGIDAHLTLCKINAWLGIGDTFFVHKEKRVKIKAATITPNSKLSLLKVIPEGKKEMSFESFLQAQ